MKLGFSKITQNEDNTMSTKIRTKYRTPENAAKDIVRKINKTLVGVGEVEHIKRDGDHFINFENIGVFDPALGFMDGSGILGYEGLGNCGCYFGGGIDIECVNGYMARVGC